MGKFIHVDPEKAKSGMQDLVKQRSSDKEWLAERSELDRLDRDVRRQRDREHEAATTGRRDGDAVGSAQREGKR